MLPSEVRKNATTYDLMVSDIYKTWVNIKNNPNAKQQYYDTEQLKDIIAQQKQGKK